MDHKRSNAINICMTKLPPPRTIKTAILKMDATIINKEGIEVSKCDRGSEGTLLVLMMEVRLSLSSR